MHLASQNGTQFGPKIGPKMGPKMGGNQGSGGAEINPPPLFLKIPELVGPNFGWRGGGISFSCDGSFSCDKCIISPWINGSFSLG